MKCTSCDKENRPGSKFCRFCGGELSVEEATEKTQLNIKTDPDHLQVNIKIPRLSLSLIKKKFFPKNLSNGAVIVAILFVIFSGTAVYAAPKVNDYLEVNNAIKEAEAREELGEYESALSALEGVESRWALDSQKERINALKDAQNRYVEYEKSIENADKKTDEGSLKEARDILQSISIDYPQYEEEVQVRLSKLQDEIETGLEADKSAAEARAQAEATAKARAQADAAAATEAKARADAAASAAAEQARQAEYQRQQEASQKQEQVRISFINQLSAGYQSYLNAFETYGSAISYSNNYESILALSQANSSLSSLAAAKNSVSNLNSRFSGLSSEYYAAASNMNLAIDYLEDAISLLVASEGTSLDYSSSINSKKNLSVSYVNQVYSFLNSH